MKKLLIGILILGSVSSFAQTEPQTIIKKIDMMKSLCDSHNTSSSNIYDALSKMGKASKCLVSRMNALKDDAPNYEEETAQIVVETIDLIQSACRDNSGSSSASEALSKMANSYRCMKKGLDDLKSILESL